ncbi:class I SAM-dependent methyltransferase [Planctomycetales bacterium ZRK34]|nr:class I SAM-dependent methyltransferase [Planctomycetales bacterium ZRK34]
MNTQTVEIEHADRMDRMYRYVRHVYDASRKYYLLGRDRLLRQMDLPSGATVCEVGCGTARNLLKLHESRPDLRLFGVDAAASMLETAAGRITKRGAGDRIVVRRGLAEQLDRREMFGLDEPFDAVFFSYALSMMPTWREAIDAALLNVASGSKVYIVDFCDLAEYPRWCAAALRKWLDLFGVHHRPELLEHLHGLRAAGRCELGLSMLYRRYAYIATLRRTDVAPGLLD